MAQKGYISEQVSGGRIVSHGKIEDLSEGFRLPGGEPFSIYVRPKQQTDDIDTTINLRCYQDEESGDAPVAFYEWSPMMVAEIAPVSDLLEDFDIWWGSGCYING